MRAADLIVKLLKNQGVATIFGFPGGAIMPLYDAIYDSGLKHVLARHEQGAAFSAIGYARTSGKTGVCLSTSGPGATNLITGLADALLDSVPMVVITGQVASELVGTDAFQEVDVLGLSLSVTKHSFIVTDPAELNQTIPEAFLLANEGRPGPVLIDIPRDVQLGSVQFVPFLTPTSQLPKPGDEKILRARKMLKTAKRPLLYVGGGVGMACAVDPLRDFQSQTRMPSVSTLKGIGTLSPDTQYYLGMLGMHGNPAANKAVQQCDLLLCVGARFDDRVTGKIDEFAPKAKIIHIDVDPAEISKRRPVDLGLLGDLCTMLPRLAQKLDISPWLAMCDALKSANAWRYDRPGDHIYAPALLKQLSDMKPKGSVVCCDVGQHQMWVAQHMAFDGPDTHLSSGGLGAMGFGLPAAIGAQMAKPDRCIINVAGDGSFMMNVQELATVRRYHLPIKIVIMDNQRLGMVKQWQQLFFEERYSETILSDNPDFVRLAEVFDIPGRRIEKMDAVLPALQEMINAPGAYLLHVKINPDDNVWPLVPPGAANDNMLEEKP